ncbi:hypothetical protein [Bradyrhizobium iriomotense]|uniref:hypothetical protein n=1 Tax=Bradyrhizobium iriomotense TaxID=441950 RepID=UPI0024E04582|nr:hypothetical protein [Bradyrhizobium iriomotense]
MNPPTSPAIGSDTSPSAQFGSDVELTPTGKFAVWSSIASILFFNQIAYNIGEFPVASDLLCYTFFTFYLVASGNAALSVPTLYLLTCTVALAILRRPFSASETSLSSLLLVVVAYTPFVFRLRRTADLRSIQDYILKAYVTAATVIAVIAVVQFVVVNVAKLDIFTNIYFVLPKEIRGAGTFTFLREEGGITKANGFFLREAAELSTVMALALLIEYRQGIRPTVLALLSMGLVVSFSGSGLTVLALGLLLPRSISRIPVFVISALGALLLLYTLANLQIPGLDRWFSRLSELNTQNTSGYARFVAPWEMIRISFDRDVWTIWLGNGAGSFIRDVNLNRFGYEVSDPTWAKLTYEYGLAGLILVSAIVITRLYSSALRVDISHFYFFSWVIFPLVLKPSSALMIWLLTLVPSSPRSFGQNDRSSRRTTPAAAGSAGTPLQPS